MGKVFSVLDRQTVFDYILSVAAECGRIVSLVQVGSGANGYHDERSDLDFVIALDSGESMPEVMEYMPTGSSYPCRSGTSGRSETSSSA